MVDAITLLPVAVMVVAVSIAGADVISDLLEQRHERKMKVLKHKQNLDREMMDED